MTAYASSPTATCSSSTTSFVIEEVMTGAACQLDPHVRRGCAFVDLDDLSLEDVTRAESHGCTPCRIVLYVQHRIRAAHREPRRYLTINRYISATSNHRTRSLHYDPIRSVRSGVEHPGCYYAFRSLVTRECSRSLPAVRVPGRHCCSPAPSDRSRQILNDPKSLYHGPAGACGSDSRHSLSL
jgi:hypothetical protein